MMKKILLTAVTALSVVTTLVNDYTEHRIYSDKNFEQDRAKVVRMLKDRGCRVHDVDADDSRGQPVPEVEVFRDDREYDTTSSYPDLRIIRERADY